MVNTIENLLNLNTINTDINSIKFYTVATTRPDLILKNNQLIDRVETFSTLEQKHKEHWKSEDFDYRLTNLGFRGIDIPKHISLAAFGCSYTFGQGLPEHKIWHRLLDEKSYNFGQPGASIKSITDMFLIISNNLKLDKAIFLLPNYVRQIVATESYSDKSISLVPLLQNYKGTFQSDYDIELDSYYKYTPNIELIRRMKDDLYLVDHISKIRGIKLYVSSWDRPTYNLIKLMNFNNTIILPEWTSPESEHDKTELARDRLHPGMSHHKYWADQIRDIVFK
jgi:hypothetical protein